MKAALVRCGQVLLAATLLMSSRSVWAAPEGWVDVVDATGRVSGWAADTSNTSLPILVHFYVDQLDSAHFAGWTTAGIPRADVTAAMNYPLPGNHGFTFIIPNRSSAGVSLRGGAAHRLYAFGIGLEGQPNLALNGASNAAPYITQRLYDMGTYGPMSVSPGNHPVVMEFEPWFGLNGIHFDPPRSWGPQSTPCSARPVYAPSGYDSADPAIITRQLQDIQALGANALLVDMTNGIGCTFRTNSDTSFALCPDPNPADPRSANDQHVSMYKGSQTVKANIGVLYEIAHQLSLTAGLSLKIIPLIGAQDAKDFLPSGNGRNGVQNAIEYFRSLQDQYPGLSVIFEGHPLINFFHGAKQLPAVDWNRTDSGVPFWQQTEKLLNSRFGGAYTGVVTWRHTGGFFDDQTQWRATPGINPINNILYDGYGYPIFWSFVDRYNTSAGLYPSYATAPGTTSGYEAFTASMGAPGKSGGVGPWGNWTGPNGYPTYNTGATLVHCSFAASDRGCAFKRYMAWAGTHCPTFLFVQQWNEYVDGGDQGWDAFTRTDIEPHTVLNDIGNPNSTPTYENYNIVQGELTIYRQVCPL
jgi:hypothetical protein